MRFGVPPGSWATIWNALCTGGVLGGGGWRGSSETSPLRQIFCRPTFSLLFFLFLGQMLSNFSNLSPSAEDLEGRRMTGGARVVCVWLCLMDGLPMAPVTPFIKLCLGPAASVKCGSHAGCRPELPCWARETTSCFFLFFLVAIELRLLRF